MKKMWIILTAILLVIMMIPSSNAFAATEKTVKNQQELKDAIADKNISVIKLANDIETTEKITTTRPVTIDGNGHTMKYVGTFGKDNSKDNTVWGSIYLLQAYKTSLTLRDIKLTGGNAAVLANGSTVRLEGTVDVSGNGFGGIELSQGKDVTETAKIVFADDSKLINTTDGKNAPTLWVPSDSDPAIVEMNGKTATIASGDELQLIEVEAILDDLKPENPKTGDFINVYIGLGLIGMTLFLITFKSKTIKEF